MKKFLANANYQQLIGVGVAVLLIVVTISIFFFANKWEEEDKKMQAASEGTDYSSLMTDSDSMDISIGATDKYEWSQGDSEMEVFVNLTKYGSGTKLKPKDLQVEINEDSLLVKVCNQTVIDGKLQGRVLAEDSCWLIDEIKSSIINKEVATQQNAYTKPDNTDQVLWITLFKSVPVSSRGDYWPALLVGEKEAASRSPRTLS